jgi:hypothetical protein
VRRKKKEPRERERERERKGAKKVREWEKRRDARDGSNPEPNGEKKWGLEGGAGRCGKRFACSFASVPGCREGRQEEETRNEETTKKKKKKNIPHSEDRERGESKPICHPTLPPTVCSLFF